MVARRSRQTWTHRRQLAGPGSATRMGRRGLDRGRLGPVFEKRHVPAKVALRAVTFDFWSTLVDGAITPERTASRLARLHASIVGAGHQHTPEELRAAFERALARVDAEARENLVDIGPPGRWAILAAELGIPPGMI